jgi:hypothetical protein
MGKSCEKQGESREKYRSETLKCPSSLCCAVGVYTLLHCFLLCHRRIFAAELSKIKKNVKFKRKCHHAQAPWEIWVPGNIPYPQREMRNSGYPETDQSGFHGHRQ